MNSTDTDLEAEYQAYKARVHKKANEDGKHWGRMEMDNIKLRADIKALKAKIKRMVGYRGQV